ncbi:hypothetical protein BN1708_003687 [Verticillium longisporum]|uniref:Uncharacterized protein n=1 Tax=Verticillium longisporum TaxID=100787 RepID=A0A0G4LN42_VERLO|nr:hypothetical protein BN1708_003687 [Verticillium longisporum]
MSKGCRRALISQRPAEASEMYRAAGLFHLRRAGRVASPQRVHDMSSETLPKSFAVQGYPVNSGPTRSKIPGANHDFSGKVRSPQRMTWFSYRSGAEYPIRSADCLVLPGMLQPPSDVISRGTAFPCASAPISFSPMVSCVQMLASLEEACCSDSRSDTRAAATPVPDLRQAAMATRGGGGVK